MLQPPNLLKPAFQIWPEKHKLVREYKCPICKKDIIESDFRNILSKKEYIISGLCQECQDKAFGID